MKIFFSQKMKFDIMPFWYKNVRLLEVFLFKLQSFKNMYINAISYLMITLTIFKIKQFNSYLVPHTVCFEIV